jgi:NAD(P)-dependent dehydrogenase (short-subunit alcohol dehydrogenase family)
MDPTTRLLNLSGRTAIITGSARGIGRHCPARWAQASIWTSQDGVDAVADGQAAGASHRQAADVSAATDIERL